MATDTDKLSADASLQANPSKSINPMVPSSDNPDRFEDSAISPPSTVISDSDDRKKDDDDSKVSALASETIAPATDTEKKIRRAERFGINIKLSEQEKRNSRAERFGTAAASGTSSATGSGTSSATGSGGGSGTSSTVNNAEALKRKARAERFGLPVSADEDAKKKARVQRFAPSSKTDVVEESKKKARELRFSQPSNTLSMNGKGDIEPAAIAGKAGGGA
ncbi:protein MODIFIER OF SNC1 11 isoform X2 [Euphorbia lathyris]|uniref:protein MODIFIER OF SNC1 11 isoform X2 n=1 Tax=Euphorbia lathyris TaxID=212925 RepID=UPI0033143676